MMQALARAPIEIDLTAYTQPVLFRVMDSGVTFVRDDGTVYAFAGAFTLYSEVLLDCGTRWRVTGTAGYLSWPNPPSVRRP